MNTRTPESRSRTASRVAAADTVIAPNVSPGCCQEGGTNVGPAR